MIAKEPNTAQPRFHGHPLIARLYSALPIALICTFAFYLRSAHLFYLDTHYYIISQDSYFFHWEAERIINGEPVLLDWHSGLAYPLVYISKFLSWLLPMSSNDALTLATKFVPPFLGVITILVFYLATCRIFNRRVALFSAFAFSIMSVAVLIQAAGNIDRDCLSMLLIMMGVFLFYLSDRRQIRLRNMDIGWIVAGLSIAAIAEIVYWEWEWIGRWLMMFVIVCFFAAWSVIGYLTSEQAKSAAENKYPSSLARQSVSRIKMVFADLNWRVFLLAMFLVILSEFIFSNPLAHLDWASMLASSVATENVDTISTVGSDLIINAVDATRAIPIESQVAEMQMLTLGTLLGFFGLLALPAFIGVIIMFRRREKSHVLVLSWMFALFLLGLVAQRNFIYALPAACLAAGLGLSWFFHSESPKRWWRITKRVAAICFMVVLILSYTAISGLIGSDGSFAVNNDWIEALEYIREETPSEAVMMTWWDWGYFILDVGERTPLVDNGSFINKPNELYDIARVYCTSNTSEAAQIMRDNGAGYFILSHDDIARIPHISKWAKGYSYTPKYIDGELTIPYQLKDSLLSKALEESFDAEGGLEVAFRNDSVVILRLQ